MPDAKKPASKIFNADIHFNAGYLYTTNASLSSVIANRRLTEATLLSIDIQGKKILDIGCGDGEYSIQLFDGGKPSKMAGVDVADEAIKIANKKKGDRDINFVAGDGSRIPFADHQFDIACLRGLLHHVDDPRGIINEAFRVAPVLLIIEPNGWNPLLKLIEKLSSYHREHRERSFSSRKLNHWVEQLGGRVETGTWLGLVPFFCPDWMAKFLKTIEPVIEKIPVINALSCAVYVFVARKD